MILDSVRLTANDGHHNVPKEQYSWPYQNSMFSFLRNFNNDFYEEESKLYSSQWHIQVPLPISSSAFVVIDFLSDSRSD